MLHSVNNLDGIGTIYNLNLDSDSASLLLLGGVVWTVIWLFVLATVLSRKDLDSVTRLTWVVVLIFVPFFGVLIYAFSSPTPRKGKKIDLNNDVAGTPWENNPGFGTKSNTPGA